MEGSILSRNLFAQGKYPLIDSWFFMTTPLPMISLIMIYLWFIFKIGPEFMKHKKPFSLTWVIRLYNIFQVIACIAFIVKIHREGFSFKNTWKCINEVETNVEVSKDTVNAFSTVWWFLMLRFFEFIETVFFVLKKKQNQISTLHIYHHVSTGVLLWLFLKYSGGMMEVFILAINACVHIVMYAYYLGSNFKQTTGFLMKLKPLITTIQIFQLVLILGHCFAATPLFGCHASPLFYLQIPNIMTLIYLFSKFYKSSFTKKNRA